MAGVGGGASLLHEGLTDGGDTRGGVDSTIAAGGVLGYVVGPGDARGGVLGGGNVLGGAVAFGVLGERAREPPIPLGEGEDGDGGSTAGESRRTTRGWYDG